MTDTWSYDNFADPTSYSASVSGSGIFSQTFTRDKLGRITTKTETIQGTTDTYVYGYDAAGRLETVTKNGSLLSSYTYDANGNRQSKATAAGTETYTVDNQDRLLTQNSALGTQNFAYSSNGELQSKTSGSQTTTYQYDVLSNLRHVTMSDGTQIEYIIDAQNRRIGKKVNGVLVQSWLYRNQLNPVAELDGSNSVVATFVYGSRSNVPDYMVKADITYRIISDHLGSPRLIINTANGSIAQRLDYDEFGSITQDTNPAFQPFAFAGGLYDPQTQLTRFGTRDYDPETGRWTAKDPISFSGGDSNLYGYVLNDPINFTDPFGLVRWPTDYPQVTAPFGESRPSGPHTGVDIRNPLGGSVYSSDEGIVTNVWSSERGGNQISILNKDGSISGYAHTKALVKIGDRVPEGQVIGHSDASGKVTPHLHYTLKRPKKRQGKPRRDCPKPPIQYDKVDPIEHILGAYD